MAEMKTLTLNGSLFNINDKTARVSIGNLLENNKPLVLDDSMAETYSSTQAYGDVALQAILEGKQILVKTPNADGGTFTAIYSPVYMYQLPNHDNNYLYLFYLKDTKQNIDLSAVGMGVLQMPEYGQLKMVLSKTYNESPLTTFIA